MLFDAPVLALLGVSVVDSFFMLLAGVFAVQILRRWDLGSGSAAQIALERRTYFISTIMGFVFVAELLSLLLFVYVAERLSIQFVGAMCATGALNVNAFGWPTLLLKIAVFFLGFVWLSVNGIDQKGYDYPLIRTKYLLLLAIAPVLITETFLQWSYFLRLDPQVITSCCGSLFSGEARGVASELASLPRFGSLIAFYTSAALTLAAAAFAAALNNGTATFAITGSAAFVVAIAAIVSVISPYVYEQPHHHCPFCLLKAGYDYIGYYLYVPLFAATALALSAGVMMRFRHKPSLAIIVPMHARRFALLAGLGFVLFYAIATYAVLRSHLVLEGM